MCNVNYPSEYKIMNHDQTIKLANEWHKQQLCIVFTNGCFDLVHLGHIDYLEKARQLGEKLIVALNTNQSIKKIKNPERPIIDEYARARLIAALQFVDIVTLFNDDTPIELIKAIRPNILVKGGDYTYENIVGAEFVTGYGGLVQTIPLMKNHSTTLLIQKIRSDLHDATEVKQTDI